MIRQYELVEKIKSYNPYADEHLLNRAYIFALRAHGAQQRANGDPYFSHPLEVAGILADYKLDINTIVASLLHDTIEDTDITLDDITLFFGLDVARLVDGVTKLNRIELRSEHYTEAENFRKLVLAMSQDIRVLLVKLADRLHNMRTLSHIKDKPKRHRIARETLDIFVPLCERIGMRALKSELEDIAFAELQPHCRNFILQRLGIWRKQGEYLLPLIINDIRNTLLEHNLVADLSGREKTPFSIWQKMRRHDRSFEQLSDIMAFRVIVDSVEECYRALGIIHSSYPVIPQRFKDYISVPKPNGYRSLHTDVIGPQNHRIEIQIRTHDMHEVAELGVAAHWQYKNNDKKVDASKYIWLRNLLDILENAGSVGDFLENAKLQMYNEEILCFTPKGDLIALPCGATVLDFAYAVHSEVGDHCVGGKINGKIRTLRTILRNGDQVEVMTSLAQKPSPTWEKFVVTGKARCGIRRALRHAGFHGNTSGKRGSLRTASLEYSSKG
jgi:GTP pyrophosphokinase